jgi:hypothetical protein
MSLWPRLWHRHLHGMHEVGDEIAHLIGLEGEQQTFWCYSLGFSFTASVSVCCFAVKSFVSTGS